MESCTLINESTAEKFIFTVEGPSVRIDFFKNDIPEHHLIMGIDASAELKKKLLNNGSKVL